MLPGENDVHVIFLPTETIEKELMVLTGAVLSINRALCMGMELILATFHP